MVKSWPQPWQWLHSFSACPPQLGSTHLSSVQCSCCVYWPALWLATSWTGGWRSVKRKMHTQKQRRGMKWVQWLLFRFRHMHCCIGVRKTIVYYLVSMDFLKFILEFNTYHMCTGRVMGCCIHRPWRGHFCIVKDKGQITAQCHSPASVTSKPPP